jgi:3-hydroxybutyryl-CoA dehydrogenase
MPLVEIVAGQQTPPEVLNRVCELVRSIGKSPVRVNRDVPGFIGNRLLHAMWREAINLVQQGVAFAEDIDLVARMTFGLRMALVGPLENMDLVGLDLVQSIHEYLLRDSADDKKPLQTLNSSVAQGHLGIKSGRASMTGACGIRKSCWRGGTGRSCTNWSSSRSSVQSRNMYLPKLRSVHAAM